MDRESRAALTVWTFLLFYLLPAAVLLAVLCKDFRETVFGPDYYDRHTPRYRGEPSRWTIRY